jgi:FMN reductase (NADPH)
MTAKFSMSPWKFGRSLLRILSGRPRLPAALADNPLLQVIFQRRSIRRFADHPIPEDAFQAILEAGRLAPSTVNLQSWSFAVFTAESWKAAFARPIPFKAQRAIIVMADIHRTRAVIPDFPRSPLVEYTIGVVNASLAAMNMNITAEALGISSVMLSETGRTGVLDIGYLREKLALPDGVFPLFTLVLGAASGPYPPMPPKLPLDQVCFSGTYPAADPRILQDWIDQMAAGYKASFPNSSLEAQLQVYQSKIGQAEQDLRQMVFYDDSPPPPGHLP